MKKAVTAARHTPVPEKSVSPAEAQFPAAVQLSVKGKSASRVAPFILTEGAIVRLGRAPGCDLTIPFDPAVSRKHADLCWQRGRLRVTCLPTARNSLRHQNVSVREVDVQIGQTFTIGSTIFSLRDVPAASDVPDTVELQIARQPAEKWTTQTYTPGQLEKVEFHNADQQLQLLTRLPELISEAQSDTEFGLALCGLLMEAIPQADAVAVARFDMTQIPPQGDSLDDFPRPLIMRVQTREDFTGSFTPSRRIIQQALNELSSVLHIWRSSAMSAGATVSPGLGWAACAPVRADACRGWCMYVSGHGTRHGGGYISEAELAPDLRFTELVAQFIGSVRQVRLLQEEKTRLNAFFSPNVIDSLTVDSRLADLDPAERDVTVMFCDVRGFSRKAEQNRNNLATLLQSVRQALGVMVDGILEFDGTIADFQGDAAMGFWGWPVALEYGPIPACRAALAIHRHFSAASQENELLEGYSIGIGIAHGRAIAGQIGTSRQSKVGVFGPVVNQCSRLESMTKQFGVSVCIDAATAEFVDRYFPESEGRLRPLAAIRPHGMNTPINVCQLLPSEKEAPEISGQTLKDSRAVRDAVVAGEWDAAVEIMRRIPDSDGLKQFLLHQMDACGNKPPPDWDGVFSLSTK